MLMLLMAMNMLSVQNKCTLVTVIEVLLVRLKTRDQLLWNAEAAKRQGIECRRNAYGAKYETTSYISRYQPCNSEGKLKPVGPKLRKKAVSK